MSAFENPHDFWSHTGDIIVELVDGAPTDNVPEGVKVDGNTISFNGTASQIIPGIQFSTDGKTFYWGYSFLKAIRHADGRPIWINPNNAA